MTMPPAGGDPDRSEGTGSDPRSEVSPPSDRSGPGRRPSSRSLVAGGTAIALVMGVVGGVVGGVIVHATSSSSSVADRACRGAAVSESVLPSVVTLSVRQGTSSETGSGEVIRTGGYILTNDHVIALGAGAGGTVDVLFSNGSTQRATVVGRSTALDLAVVRVPDADGLSVIRVGTSHTLRVGQPVVALGAPLGLDGTVTSGIVSALGRDVTVPVAEGQMARLPDAVQTDASINPGNSGGALVDCSGHLVGINTAIATVPTASGESAGGNVGIGFAIPVDLATVVADQLISTGEFSQPYTGLTTVPVQPHAGSREGLFVLAVDPDGPAAAAGLQAGDIITTVEGRAATSHDGLILAILRKRAGDQVTVEYVRGGETRQATVTLAAPPGS